MQNLYSHMDLKNNPIMGLDCPECWVPSSAFIRNCPLLDILFTFWVQTIRVHFLTSGFFEHTLLDILCCFLFVGGSDNWDPLLDIFFSYLEFGHSGSTFGCLGFGC